MISMKFIYVYSIHTHGLYIAFVFIDYKGMVCMTHRFYRTLILILIVVLQLSKLHKYSRNGCRSSR